MAKELGVDYISTGHYANIGMLNDRYFIKKGVDLQKDQSYVLWQLPQEYLQKIIFPLGVFCKKDIKHIAKENNLYEFIDAKESEDICFLPKGNYRALIREEKHEEVKSEEPKETPKEEEEKPKGGIAARIAAIKAAQEAE